MERLFLKLIAFFLKMCYTGINLVMKYHQIHEYAVASGTKADISYSNWEE